ncbi:hypothetical protein, partial [uncultured Oscillibacter sp.]|uniref:hypothetical protein n=1 Tax=uncultured Oscillibacter sp. TaxID=876091 RepID=UPI0026E2BADF
GTGVHGFAVRDAPPIFSFSERRKRENPPEGPLAASRLTLAGRARSKREKDFLVVAEIFRFD